MLLGTVTLLALLAAAYVAGFKVAVRALRSRISDAYAKGVEDTANQIASW